MNEPITGTTLVITAVVCVNHQTSLRNEEQGEDMYVVALEDTKTGETGHLCVVIAYDGRSIDDEDHSTDNPALFADNHPEADWYCIDGIMTADECDGPSPCDHRLEYRDGDAGWGLYNAE